MPEVTAYLSKIGAVGGRKSRRKLSIAQAKDMVRVREARRLYVRFHTTCFWSSPDDLKITILDVPWVAERLREHGGLEGWRRGEKLCR